MPRISIEPKNREPTAIALLVVPLACLGLGACGSSSGGSSSNASTPTTAAHTTMEATPSTQMSTAPASTIPRSTTPTRTAPTSVEPTITTGRQYDSLIECLRHNGIKLPPINELSRANVNTNTPHFKAAYSKCKRAVLRGRLRR